MTLASSIIGFILLVISFFAFCSASLCLRSVSLCVTIVSPLFFMSKHYYKKHGVVLKACAVESSLSVFAFVLAYVFLMLFCLTVAMIGQNPLTPMVSGINEFRKVIFEQVEKIKRV
jgi:cytosine/uracil/thiamine/allantoin permease